MGYVVIKVLPDQLAASEGLGPGQLSAERGRVRTALIAMVGGTIAVVGAYFTAHTFLLSRRGQNNDRFSRAIEHLGHEDLDVRLGGIFELEHLLHDSPSHRPQIVAVLTAYVRGHSPWPPVGPVPPEGGAPWPATADTQAVIDVLAHASFEHQEERLRHRTKVDLGSTNLRGIRAEALNLEGARLWRAQLRDAILPGARLVDANLVAVDARDATLREADLSGAVLTGARLEGADLTGASYNAQTRWDGAIFDDSTSLPDDQFDIPAAGAKRV